MGSTHPASYFLLTPLFPEPEFRFTADSDFGPAMSAEDLAEDFSSLLPPAATAPKNPPSSTP